MERSDSKGRIIKETIPSEFISVIGHIFTGIVLIFLILPFESFSILILFIPALLSLRGNISGPFIARTARDLIIGEFNLRSWLENVLAIYVLSIITAILVGILAIILNMILFRYELLRTNTIFAIPMISTLIAVSITFPCSTLLNYIAFKYGLDPNNIVHPIMTFVGDFITVFSFYLTLIILGVP